MRLLCLFKHYICSIDNFWSGRDKRFGRSLFSIYYRFSYWNSCYNAFV